MPLRLLVTLLALSALLIPACAEGAPENGESDGRTPRVAALSPALGVILRDLGLERHVVGRHAFDETLPDSIPVVGDQSGIDYEALARVRPTHVLLEWGARELPTRLVRIADERDWTLESYPMLTLGDIRAAARSLASQIGDDAAAARAERLLREMNRAWAPAPELTARAGRTLPLYWTDPPGAAGPGSFHVQMLESMGITTALREGAAYIELDLERVKRLAPDSILLFMPGADPARLDELLGPLSRLDLDAVRAGRVAVISHPLALSPSTGLIEVARELRRAIQEWAPLEGGEPLTPPD